MTVVFKHLPIQDLEAERESLRGEGKKNRRFPKEGVGLLKESKTVTKWGNRFG